MFAVRQTFRCMGCDAEVRLESVAAGQDELRALAAGVRARLEAAGRALTRFDPASELCALNIDPRPAVPVSPLVAELVRAAAWAGARSGGLVDATRLAPLERVGYAESREAWEPVDLDAALAAAPPRRPARAHPVRAWRSLRVDDEGRALRAHGVRLDSGGLGKGLAADLAAAALPRDVRYAIDLGGDVALGPDRWDVAVLSARGGEPVRRLSARGGVATSGIHARIWRRPDGRFAHHLLDPSTGEPAWTGLVAVTAVADSTLEAEVLAKAALLSGPEGARRLLARRGGVLQHDDGRVEEVPGLHVVRLRAVA